MINSPLILDGGLSNALEQEGADLNHHLWSAKLLIEQSEMIEKVHYNYLRAGARCIITSSYQATIDGFLKEGKSNTESIELLKQTTALAVNAKNKFLQEQPKEKIFIAGSIGPYGAFLADGSEYRGNYNKSVEELVAFHQKRFSIIDNTAIDFLACETVPSFDEVKAIATLLKSAKHKGWISCSCKDGMHLNDGTPIREVAEFLKEEANVYAMGVNCTKPIYISSLIKEIRKANKEIKIVVYPNSGQVYHTDTKTWSGISDPHHCGMMAQEWVKLGADIVGGCCQMGYTHIKAMSESITK
ncbi:homocysteine S-methyltransferase [Flammeovirga aprica]|uniref:S-methylmethionine:homocysteine methyltransferase n=1 Tax=Flammeovirga aprica JL-4 TaxID=694437 RepID=A0A7X9P093_9BACT|nr:homocysteine S-methyltransferase [Flammeovirga aprica]NME66637.1 homocysteine S-methyltransferase [Flammeovirga aprica JL-4]